LNRTANKGNSNNNDTEKGDIQNKPPEQNRSRTERLLHAPELRVSSHRAAPPTRTQHYGTWYGIPALFGQVGFGSARLAVPLPGFW